MKVRKTKFKAPPADLQTGSRPSEQRGKKTTLHRDEDDEEEENDWGDDDSEESAEEEKMQEGIVDVEKYEYQTGAHMRMQNALSEQNGILERSRYIETNASAQTIKIIGGPDELNKIYGELFDEEVARRSLGWMGNDEDTYL